MLKDLWHRAGMLPWGCSQIFCLCSQYNLWVVSAAVWSERLWCSPRATETEAWPQANMFIMATRQRVHHGHKPTISWSGNEWGTGEHPASVAAIGRWSGFCSNSSSILSFREHLMAAQTGYFSCPHIAIDLEKVNWCLTEISRSWLNMQKLWWTVLGERSQCYSTDNFPRNLAISCWNHPNAVEIHWNYSTTFSGF